MFNFCGFIRRKPLEIFVQQVRIWSKRNNEPAKDHGQGSAHVQGFPISNVILQILNKRQILNFLTIMNFEFLPHLLEHQTWLCCDDTNSTCHPSWW